MPSICNQLSGGPDLLFRNRTPGFAGTCRASSRPQDGVAAVRSSRMTITSSAEDDSPPAPPPRTTSIRYVRKPTVSKSLANLTPASDMDGRKCRRSPGATSGAQFRHVYSSSSSSCGSSNNISDSFLESLRREFSVPEFRLRSVGSAHSVVAMSLSTECMSSPSAASECSPPGLANPGRSPDGTKREKGQIVRSARVEQPEKQHVCEFAHFASSSTASVSTTSSTGSSLCSPASPVQGLSPGVQRLSVVSSGGTSSSSGVGESSGESGPGRGSAIDKDERNESPPPPLPPKLFHLQPRSRKSSVRYTCIANASDSGSKQHQTKSISSKKTGRESDSRSIESHPVQQPAEQRLMPNHSNLRKNNAFSIGAASSDRKACEKSGSSNRMIYLDALKRVKTSDTEIRAIQKRALLEFYFNYFKENTKNTRPSPSFHSSPDGSSVTLPSSSCSLASTTTPIPHRSADEESEAGSDPRPQQPASACADRTRSPAPLQTALPARVLPVEAEDRQDDMDDVQRGDKKREGGADLQAGYETDAAAEGKETSGMLAVLLQRKMTLLQDFQQNQALASELMSKLKRNGLSPHESEKISNHCSEIDTVTRLVLSLRSRLRSIEKGWKGTAARNQAVKNNQENNHQAGLGKNGDNNNSDQSGITLNAGLNKDAGLAHSNSCSRPSSPDSSSANNEHDVLTRKRNKLLIQMEEAMSLKDMIEKRSSSIRDNILSKHLAAESEANHSIDYIGLMYAKSKLITEISDVSERIAGLRKGSQSVSSDLTRRDHPALHHA